MHWGDDVLLLYLAPFFKPHSAKMRKSDTRCESKQECSSSKADELESGVQCGVTAHLAI